MRITTAVALILGVVAATSAASDRRAVNLEGASPNAPYSSAVWSGDFLHVSGTLGSVPGEGYPSDIEAQTRQTFANLKRILETAGSDLSRVVSVSVYLTDDRHYDAMNKVFRETFPSDAPTRATVRTDLAAPAGYIEISMIAAGPDVSIRRITPEGWQPSGAGYAYGILAGDTLFVAGLVSNDPSGGGIVNGDIEVQAKQTLDNLGAVLKAAGMDYGDVASNRVYLRDGRDFGGMNDVYRTYFSEAPPARATVRAGIMHPDLRIEVHTVAVKDGSRKVGGEARAGSVLSPSIVAGGRQYLAGMVGRGPDGYAPGDVAAQTRQALARLEATLKAEGLGFEDVIETTVFLTDVRHFGIMNDIYREVVPGPRPARTTVGTALMSPDALVEIQMIANTEK